jgi:hypothetical protein
LYSSSSLIRSGVAEWIGVHKHLFYDMGSKD